ncbi:MAG: FtsH protease activity modulator HflK [Acidobacteria bacterium]|nr:FtsH protease activity modulator HflK [Acidobacteriota bacterium]MCI0721486.1 FtsH protease activity modulator HflK [Acidobacteriota bacterium]
MNLKALVTQENQSQTAENREAPTESPSPHPPRSTFPRFLSAPLRQFLRKRGWALLLGAYLLSGVYFVAADQQAVVLRFSRVIEKRVLPGVHYHLPYPMESVIKLKVLETKRLTVGFEIPDQVLGRTAAEKRTLFLTGDQNLINVQLAVQYSVKDPVFYLFHSREVADLISRAVESAFAQVIATERVDSLLTTGKIGIQNTTWQWSQEILDHYGSGVFVSSINLENVTPPAEVADAFREVASARADRDRIINEAHGYADDALAKVQGEAEKLLRESESHRQQRINQASGDAARFEKLLAEYRKAREVTEKRLYLETMEEILPKIKKVIIDGSGNRDLMDLGIIRSIQ